MTKLREKPVARLKPSRYQPSKAKLEDDISIDATPEELLRAVVRDVRIEIDKDG